MAKKREEGDDDNKAFILLKLSLTFHLPPIVTYLIRRLTLKVVNWFLVKLEILN